jgi:hypothetical protein
MQHKNSGERSTETSYPGSALRSFIDPQDVERALDRLGIVPPSSLQKADLDHPFDRLTCR